MPVDLLNWLRPDVHDHGHDAHDHGHQAGTLHHGGVRADVGPQALNHFDAPDTFALRVPGNRSFARSSAFLLGPEAGISPASTRSSASKFLIRAEDSAHELKSAALQPTSGSSLRATSFLFEKKGLVDFIHSVPAAALVPLHAASIVCSLPGHIAFELGEGYFFGFEKGFALAFTGKTLGTIAAFAVGRSADCLGGLRESIREKLQDWPLAKKAAKGVESGGHASVFLVRIAPLPCVVKNYSLSLLTEIPWSVFLPGTIAGLLPTTAAHVYAGTLAPSMTQLMSGQGAAMKMVAVVGTVSGVSFCSLLAAYLLHSQLDSADEKDEPEAAQEEPEQVVFKPCPNAAPRQQKVETVKLFSRPQTDHSASQSTGQ